jgi:hypothetical protein
MKRWSAWDNVPLERINEFLFQHKLEDEEFSLDAERNVVLDFLMDRAFK